MTVNDLTILEWQRWLDRWGKDVIAKRGAAMRIENTPLTSARYAGGMTMAGYRYIYFEPRDPTMPPNPDGTPYVAWLMVREDFLRWVKMELKKEAKDAKRE